MLLPLVMQAVAVLSPPSPPPRSMTAMPGPVMIARPGGERTRVAIVMRGGGAILFDGMLWVGMRGQSSWRQTLQEAPDPRCVGERPYEARQDEASIQISTSYDPMGTGTRPLLVTVRWQRPNDDGCAGARTVELRQSVVLDGSAPVMLRGDAGLTVELRRR